MREYDQALNNILTSGFDIFGDRTGTGTRCLFGINTKYDISQRIPILTKRSVKYSAIINEVLWYISGSHNIIDLENRGTKIWTPWKNLDFTKKHNLPEGSGGYIYGFNLIHFGANIDTVDTTPGYNQLDYVINTLKANPKSRQACFTFWRPDTNNCAILPACHAFYSFIVSPDHTGNLSVLNCHMFQRSNDYPIGVGMGNLLTGTLFTYMIAQQLNMSPGSLYHSGAHCHIYNNTIEQTTEYCSREQEPDSPILTLNHKESIYDYTLEDFTVTEYSPLSAIKFPISV
jgi:thymidylate synthase